MKKIYICLFEVYLFVAEDPVSPCALVGMTLFRNVYMCMSMFRNMLVININAMEETNIVIIYNVQLRNAS